MRKAVCMMLLVLAVAGCRSYVCPPLPEATHFNGLMCDGLGTGMLLFVYGQDGGMDEAIVAATGQYSHVAMVECTDSGVYVLEALPRKGVVRGTLDAFLRDNAMSEFDLYYVDAAFDTAALLQRMSDFVGMEYDDYFAPNNDRLYCSELVYECFLDKEGNHLFSAQPMNFNDAQGRLPQYWQDHFDSLGVMPPQGVIGTNPTDMSKAKFLNKIRIE